MSSLPKKIAETVDWLRFGPTRLRQLQETHGHLERRIADLEGLREAHNELTRAVMAKAADVDLQFVRNSLAAQVHREAGWLRDQVSALAAALDKVGAAGQGGGAKAPSVAAAEDAFYPALEQQFRGSHDDIQGRLRTAYQPWMQGLPAAPVADLGCGRGEWLELLREWKLPAVGVDLNSLHVEQNRRDGFDAVCADALVWLEQRPDASLAAVTSFHVVEHLPFGVLLKLVQQARRALQPGGRLILETPNPENLLVATQSFWLDPTHLRPIPPVLLEFIVTHAGLEVEAVPRLNPPTAAETDVADPALRRLLTQGRDYAVVARKPLSA